MRIGVPKEIKDRELRVALTPAGAAALVEDGHTILVEHDAGLGSGFTDADYVLEGANIVNAEDAWDVDLVTKVKEPLESEYAFLNGQIVFTYFHLAGVTPTLTARLLETRTTAIAYETVQDSRGRLPLLAPMSAVAGNIAVTMGAYFLAGFNQGRGMLLGKVLDKAYGKVLIVGDGVVGCHSAARAIGIGANVYLAGRHAAREASLRLKMPGDFTFVLSKPRELAREVRDTDLLVGAVLSPGAKAAKVITKAMVKTMPQGSTIVDVSIDQGGCVETARPTTHSAPVFVEHGVIHYCVTNMPGAYPRTSTIALTDATLPYTLSLARHGIEALRRDPRFAKGLNTYAGSITCAPVADALGLSSRYLEFSNP